MKYQKVMTLLDKETKKPSKFITKNWTVINDKSRGTYIVENVIRFESARLIMWNVYCRECN